VKCPAGKCRVCREAIRWPDAASVRATLQKLEDLSGARTDEHFETVGSARYFLGAFLGCLEGTCLSCQFKASPIAAVPR
jgi:hypothetical protein